MRSRILALRRPFVAFQMISKRNMARGMDRCDAHMNELPIPCAPWEPWYSDKQAFYRNILVGGILWWIFSFSMALYTDSIYLNCSPPAQPGPPSDMVEECEEVD